MKSIFIKILVPLAIISLSACTTQFECPNKAGVMCKSLDQIDGMVDNGELHGVNKTSTKIHGNDEVQFNSYPSDAKLTSSFPLRTGEQVQRVWIAPYEDVEENYHQENIIYTVTKPNHWVSSPPHEIN